MRKLFFSNSSVLQTTTYCSLQKLLALCLMVSIFICSSSLTTGNLFAQEIIKHGEQYAPLEKNPTFKRVEGSLPLRDDVSEFYIQIVDGLAIYEGDIILGPAAQYDPELSNAVVSINSGFWKNGIIPYVIQKNHPRKRQIEGAIEYINAKTNLCVIPRSNEQDYVEFIQASSCASYIGRVGGRQYILIGNCSDGSIIHEICHAAGFYHEQSSPKRDSYITIHYENIIEQYKYNFDKNGINVTSYDKNSIMHYPAYAFSKNGKKTITCKHQPCQIGQRKGLSPNDIKGINTMYKNASGCAHKWENLGGQITSNPTVISPAPGKIHVYARGTDGAVWQKMFYNNKWYGWNSLGGKIPAGTNISVLADGQNQFDLFVKGMDGALFQNTWTSSTKKWTGWKSLGGQITSDPISISPARGKIQVYARGTDGAVWQKMFYNNKWYGWNSLGGKIPAGTNISVLADGQNRFDLFVKGMNGALFQNTWTSSTKKWTSWKSLGGQITSDPIAISPARGKIQVYARGTDGAVWQKMFYNNRWYGWNSLSGKIPAGTNISVLADGLNRFDLFVKGMNRALFQNTWTSSSKKWTGWKSLGGQITSDPKVIPFGTNRLNAFVRGTDNGLYLLPLSK